MKGVDTGAIVDQRPVVIRWSDDGRALYNRLVEVASAQLRAIGPRLAAGEIETTPQDDDANYWRKRSRKDGAIDWRMSSESIYNLVRALSEPYVGAHCRQKGREVKIWGVDATDDAYGGIDNLEPGNVLDVDGSTFSVKTRSGAVRVVEQELDPPPEGGSYLSGAGSP